MTIKDTSIFLYEPDGLRKSTQMKIHPNSGQLLWWQSDHLKQTRCFSIKPEEEVKKKTRWVKKTTDSCHTEVIFVKGAGHRKCATFQTPAASKKKKNWGKKKASLVDKSSFSSWLHTARGGLTCHGRIQAFIHLCFPQVFLNFTHTVKAITKTQAGFSCQPRRYALGLSSPRRILWSESRPVSFERDRQKQRAVISPNARAFLYLPVLLGVTSLLSFIYPPLLTNKQPSLWLCMPTCLPALPCLFSLALSLWAARIKHLSRWSSFRL